MISFKIPFQIILLSNCWGKVVASNEIKSKKVLMYSEIHGQTQDINTFHLPTLEKPSQNERKMMRKLFFSRSTRWKEAKNIKFLPWTVHAREKGDRKKLRMKIIIRDDTKGEKKLKSFWIKFKYCLFFHLKIEYRRKKSVPKWKT